jgi:CheY-like chemotaxis protein
LALAAIEAGEHVDLLVSDLSMPGMDGLTLIRAAQEKRMELPAILLTGYAGDAATLALGDAASGSIYLLRKPITGSELADRAAMMLERNAVDMAFT